MPETFNRGTAFGQGFASVMNPISNSQNAASNRMNAESMQQRNQMEQAKMFREQIDTSVQRSLDQLSAAAKHNSATAFSSLEPSGKQKAVELQSRLASDLWKSTEQVLNKGKENGLYTDSEIDSIRNTFELASRLRDPAAEAKREGQVEAETAGAVAEAEQPFELEQIRARGAEAQKTAAVPRVRRETITNLPPPVPADGTEPVEGIGRQVMEDTEQSTGIIAGISKGLSSIFGQFVPGTNERLDAAQRVKNFNQEVKFALSRNPKYPVAEMKAIQKDMLISPDSWLVDPEAEARKVVLMKHSLEKWNEADRIALPRLTEAKAQDALERIGTRQTMIDLIGDVPSLEDANNAEMESIQAKVLDDSATDEEITRYLELTNE